MWILVIFYQGDESTYEPIIKLLHGLNHQYDLPLRQIEYGLKKAEKYVNDSLAVDVPKAPELFKLFNEKVKQVTFVSEFAWKTPFLCILELMFTFIK